MPMSGDKLNSLLISNTHYMLLNPELTEFDVLTVSTDVATTPDATRAG